MVELKKKFFFFFKQVQTEASVNRLPGLEVKKFPAACSCKQRASWSIMIGVTKMGDYLLMAVYFQVRLFFFF